MGAEKFLHDKVILITGGSGSLGRALTLKLVRDYKPRKVIIFSRDEWKQWEMQGSNPLFSSTPMRYFLGDVRDLPRLKRAFNEVDYVVHAAALKQVPAAEYNPSEFVKTNVIGAMNIIDAAVDCQVKKVIALSTDKACNPVNLYGATKLCSDKLFVNGNVYSGAAGTPRFSVVRYGNVVGSRGSIIPLWQKQIAEGADRLFVTDERMTRFWISLDQAVDFILFCLEKAEGGEIFVPKIPSMKIIHLAAAVAPGIPFDICGMRPGEKLHEVMVAAEDSRFTLEFDNYYSIIPKIRAHTVAELDSYKQKVGGARVAENFTYSSNTNDKWLDSSSLKNLLKSSH